MVRTRLNMKISMRYCCLITISLLISGVPIPSLAQKPPSVTALELARLPEYCPHTQSFAPGGFREGPLPSQVPWIARLGPGFWHLYHYCWALVNAMRADTAGTPAQTRKHLYTRAIADIIYVLQNTTPDFILTPELHLRNGEFYEKLGQLPSAVESFELSRRAKSDYWPAYQRLAALQAKVGLLAAAENTLTEGLAISPGQVQLLTALDELRRRSERGVHRTPSAAAAASARGTP